MSYTTYSARAVVVVILATAVALLSRNLILGGDSEARSKKHKPISEKGVSTIVSEHLSFADVVLEKREGLPLHRLVIRGRKRSATDADVDKGLATIRSVLDRKQPMTIHYDVRDAGMVLSRQQLWRGITWARDRSNAHLMDTQLQCISMTMRQGIIRATIAMVVRVLSPPQPVHIGTDEESAIAFAAQNCRAPRDWTAAAAARDEKRKGSEREAASGGGSEQLNGGSNGSGADSSLLSALRSKISTRAGAVWEGVRAALPAREVATSS